MVYNDVEMQEVLQKPYKKVELLHTNANMYKLKKYIINEEITICQITGFKTQNFNT